MSNRGAETFGKLRAAVVSRKAELASAVPVEGPRLFFEYSDQDVLELFRISEWRRGGVNIVCGCEDLYGDAEASQLWMSSGSKSVG